MVRACNKQPHFVADAMAGGQGNNILWAKEQGTGKFEVPTCKPTTLLITMQTLAVVVLLCCLNLGALGQDEQDYWSVYKTGSEYRVRQGVR